MKKPKNNKDKDILEQMREVWAVHKRRTEELPFLTDEELRELYRQTLAMPSPSSSELPPVPQRRVRKNRLRVATAAAIMALPFFLAPNAYGCKMNYGANQQNVLDTIDEVCRELNR